LQELTQAGREGCIAGVNGVLRVANEMGEAELVVGFGPAQLRSETQTNQASDKIHDYCLPPRSLIFCRPVNAKA